MPSTDLQQPSYWDFTQPSPVAFPALDTDTAADVVVIGAGIVGLSAAAALSRAGKTVIVLEALRIGSQATGRSTAKVTAQHGLRYAQLLDQVGMEATRLYAQVNQQAVEQLAKLAGQLGDDAFVRKPAFLYATQADEMEELKAEAEAAMRVGLPATLTRDMESPLQVAAALRFEHQAQCNPLSLLRRWACQLAQHTTFHESTRVTEVEHGSPCRVVTDRGVTVIATDVIVATQQPIIPQGLFFAKAYPFSHSVIAAPLDDAITLGGMSASAREPSFSFRDDHSTGRRYIVASGPSFKTGVATEATSSFAALEEFLRQTFDIQHISHRWTNEDFQAMDGLPFIGSATDATPHCHVAVGFNAWGITTGTVAGELLADLILERPNPCAELFKASRLSPLQGGAKFLKGNAEAAKHLIGDRLGVEPMDPTTDLQPGQATVTRIHGEPIACSRDSDGTLRMLSAVCTHMKCLVAWNPHDLSWDCPCHGSRFDRDGTVLQGPATTPLKNLTERQ